MRRDGESFASGASSAQLRAFSLYSSDLLKMSHSVDSTSSPRAGRPDDGLPPSRRDLSVFDRNAFHLGLCFRALGEHDVQHTVLEPRLDLVFLDLDPDRDAPLEVAIEAL